MEFNYKIYALKDKTLNEIRYIGLTRNTLTYRFKQHLRDTHVCYRTNWINKNRENIEIILLKENIKTKEEACNEEINWISKLRNDGYRLVNTTNGGDGWFNTEFTETHKLNISLNHADVSGDKNPMYGKSHSKETLDVIKEKQKLWMKNGGFSDEQMDNLRKSHRGSKNSKAKLTENSVIKIRKLHNDGVTQSELSKLFNVKEPAIYKIVHRLTWKHINNTDICQ